MAQSESGAAPALPAQLLDLFRSALAPSEEELRKINAWARSNIRTVAVGDFDAAAVAEEMGVSRAEVTRAAQLVTAVFYGQPLGFRDLESYTPVLGDLAPKARLLLDGIHLDPAEVAYVRQRLIVSQGVLPTVESVDALCELRAIFQEMPSPSTSKSHNEGVGKLLGFEPMVILGLQLNDSAGNDSSCTFQVTERSLRYMLKTLQDALTQLETVREHQGKSVSRS